MSYCETTAELMVRRMSAMPPSTVVGAPVALIGRFCSAGGESIWYCGVCSAIGYVTPFFSLGQYVGATWRELARLTTRLLVTSAAVTPVYWARVRSILNSIVGTAADCWIRASAMPGIWRICARSLLAKA